MRLSELPATLPCEVVRDGTFTSLGYLTHAPTKPALLTFLERDTLLPRLRAHPHTSCVITTRTLAQQLPESLGVACSPAPGRDFFALHEHLAHHTDFYGAHFPSLISAEAEIHPRAYVAPQDVRIGRGTRVEPGALVLEGSLIGEDVLLRAGCVIGAHGMEAKRIAGRVVSIRHTGGVRIGDRVEIHANAVVVRAVFGGWTEIGDDTIIGSLVNIAHGVRIGRRCFLPDTAMVAGAVTVGDDVVIDPNATVAHELTIGDGARVTLGAVVTKDVPPGARVSGNFAIDHERLLKFIKSIR